MARPSLVCLCLCCLPALTVAFGLDIQFAPVYNATFQTASVSQYFEQSTSYLSSALCRQIPLWFCKVTPPNFPDQRSYSDSDTGISLSAHREEIDHHDLNPTSPSPETSAFWAYDHNFLLTEIRWKPVSNRWIPGVYPSTNVPSIKPESLAYNIRSYVYQI